MEKPIAIVLGGTSPHILLINKLKERGYYTILIDYLDNPPAKKYADEHIQASTLDKEIVFSIAKEKSAALIISTCIDQANSVCCYVSEKLGLPHPYSYQTSLNVTDKGLMKRVMQANGIPTSPFILTNSLDDTRWDKVVYPAVVKPVDCNSSKGVKRVDNYSEALKATSKALKISRSNMAIIEGFNQGPEIQVDCVSTNAGVMVMMTRQKLKVFSSNNDMVLQSFGSVFPAPLDERLQKEIQIIAEKIATAFNLVNTPFFYQAIVTNSGIKVIEFAPRVGGGLSHHVLKEFGHYDAIEATIYSFLGKDINVKPYKTKNFMSTNIIYMNPGVFDHIEGLAEAKEKGLIQDYFIMKQRGDVVDNDFRSSNRVAAFTVYGDKYEIIYNKAKLVLAQTEVYGVRGDLLMNRTIYSNL